MSDQCDKLSLPYRWVKLSRRDRRKLLVKYVYVSSRQDPRDSLLHGTWVEEKVPPRVQHPSTHTEPVLRNVQHLIIPADDRNSYPCAKCGQALTWGDRASIATICEPDGTKYRCVFHPQCVPPPKPRIHREWFRFLYVNAHHYKFEKDFLDSEISPKTVPLDVWTVRDSKGASEGRAKLEPLPSDTDSICATDDEQVPTSLAETVAEGSRPESESEKPLGELTPEEIEIVRGTTFEKLTWKQIAEKFNLSMRTVARRIDSAEQKLGRKLPKRTA